jgi:hypothetical protein
MEVFHAYLPRFRSLKGELALNASQENADQRGPVVPVAETETNTGRQFGVMEIRPAAWSNDISGAELQQS